jgi:hypothetical protein
MSSSVDTVMDFRTKKERTQGKKETRNEGTKMQ